jgi:hypothetical protein
MFGYPSSVTATVWRRLGESTGSDGRSAEARQGFCESL